MPVRLAVEGLAQALRGLRGATPDQTLLRTGLKRIGTYLEGVSAIAFRNREDPATGRDWPPLSPTTIALRRNRSDIPLSDTGRLKSSVTASTAVGAVRDISPSGRGTATLTFGSSLIYAATHQFGRRQHPRSPFRGAIPARPFVGVSNEDRREMAAIIDRLVAQRSRRS